MASWPGRYQSFEAKANQRLNSAREASASKASQVYTHIVDGGDMKAAKKPAILQPVQQLLRRLKMAREVTARI